VANWGKIAARSIIQGRWLILVAALVLTFAALGAARTLSVSTKLEALMPEGAASVKTLQNAMEKAGSFASIQIIVQGEDKARVERTLFILEAVTRPLPWSESVQYFEDISVLERHKLLQLSVPELEKVATTLDQEIIAATAREFKKETGIELSINLIESGVSASSNALKANTDQNATIHNDLSASVETERRFVSDDGRTQALVIWPKAGYEGLGEAKKMISDVAAIIGALELNAPDSGLQVGIAGRVRNKVAQFDAVMHDLAAGLGSSISLIMVLLLVHYRRFIAVPMIIVPLIFGIIWTIGLTALVIGGLNLITIFLALILFGLGIDFGIHNFSRYSEERACGLAHLDALALVMRHTGKASLIAGLTTSIGFLSLLFTEFRAFREFGFIAGSGILLIFLSMYTVFPALLSIIEPYIKWHSRRKPDMNKPTNMLWTIGSRYPGKILLILLPCTLVAAFGAQNITFEKNFKNIQAARTAEHLWATEQSKNIFKGGHDRAILVVETLEEVEAIEAYFETYTARDTTTPTIAKLTSVRNFVPNPAEQAERLKIIKRMWAKMEETGPLPTELADKTKYLQIDMLETSDLPPAMRRVFLGNENKPGYLMYIYNAVTMDDADLARQFYNDAAEFIVNGKTYYPASEGFIFVEMLALMKADAIRAVSLVGGATILIVLIFMRSLTGMVLILLPTAIGMLFTLALMALTNLPLSIINMVILPSLIGISVDNSIHIYQRFQEGRDTIATVMATTGKAASITTLTTLLGFGGLITASMGGLKSMGLLALIGFSSCLLLTWVLLPALLKITEVWLFKKMSSSMIGIR